MQNLFSIGRIAKRLLPIACLLLVLTGCESMRTVMTQHKVEMVVKASHPLKEDIFLYLRRQRFLSNIPVMRIVIFA
ncbi:hypothetical protein CWE13_00005 [Aliidiomarina shirensis]|uniref:Uncharacterized protein n=1 Tax=Aliidiomarina shirensis TaxID=1048642 RepID=A0A432WWC9_9GAMM|nr:hypothetical protein CWE13_00005 [Aliidiomarina shirensis]